jgi:hypothetical protein
MFYPEGVPEDPDALPQLNRKQVRDIADVLEGFVEGIKKAHSNHHGELSKLFQRELEGNFDTNLVLLNTGRPFAQIEPGGSITVDVRVAQAFYRTALISGLTDTSLGGGNFMSERFSGDEPREAEIIREFLEIKDTVEATRGRSMFGDMVEGISDDDFEGSWFTMADMAQASSAVEEHYFPPMTFLLAHEFGHGVLGHLEVIPDLNEDDEDDCEIFQYMESEADLYAMLLQILHINETNPGAFAFGAWFSEAENNLGYQDFFKYTFKLSGFSTEGMAACSHPDPEQRRRDLEYAYREVTSG